jgi:hypothetical protein
LYGIEKAQWKLAAINFCTPRREINEECFRQGIDSRSFVVFGQFGIVDERRQI